MDPKTEHILVSKHNSTSDN